MKTHMVVRMSKEQEEFVVATLSALTMDDLVDEQDAVEKMDMLRMFRRRLRELEVANAPSPVLVVSDEDYPNLEGE